ncbi:hypothetical protein WOLCODRAFT_151061 [Wolfiporia cocos MD-104 SS10]|uniref:Atypical/PIKK/TRRAP protein kinase n=1 Tax=Wolfiporia cocos (strain MD-104) TaxID=742152 RepID=A0A2H3JFP0_WOLCO|nr:hypothetical protein WOLCODRAFT_151061 [Wolfiporia cocos MD-104 SS10]
MDGLPQLTTAADLEMRAARVADPGIDLKTKFTVACELREMIDIVREAESARVIPHMVPVLLDILRSGDAAFHKDSIEYQFRRCLLDILHRIPNHDAVRPQATTLFHGMLHLLRHDNEDNGVTCCKTLADMVRASRIVNEELLAEVMSMMQDLFRAMPDLVNETLSEESPILDQNISSPAMRSFKVLVELTMVIVSFTQINRQAVITALQPVVKSHLHFLSLESPAQRKDKEDHEAMGDYLIGMSPTVKNSTAYSDFIAAQIKQVSFIAFIYRGLPDQQDIEFDSIMLTSVRLLQDSPSTSVAARKDMIVVFRHLLNTPHKRVLIPQIDKLLDERLFVGVGVGCVEAMRSYAYSCMSEILHSLRSEMTAAQLTRTCHLFLRQLHDPSLPYHLHGMSAKMTYNLIEAILTKDTNQGASRTLKLILDASVDKLESVATVQDQVSNKVARMKKGEDDPIDDFFIEKSRPIAGASYAVDKMEEVPPELRGTIRTIMHGLRFILATLKKCDAPVPDGTIISRLFESSVRCMAVFDDQPREANDAMESLGAALIEANLHVFQEVWTQKIEFFAECAEKRPALMQLAHLLIGREGSSATLVAIVLRHFINKLPQLGECTDQAAAVALRMFKMVFNAVGVYPAANEPILASHLGKLIMDCFPLAAKATKPINYYHLLRLLFRAIGSGGGRFELLYKEVLPLLPEMLEYLSRQLHASEGLTRDMLVELCLTVPLRLTHLLPYLSYLMQPLVLALRGNPELVSQGLRTLELCIDNLTPDFLDPTLNTVLRDLMEALHSHLKPLPASHHHAHTTIRILGKLGGRNRRLLEKEPSFQYQHYSESTKARISFGGTIQNIELSMTSVLAAKTLVSGKGGPSYRTYAYEFLEGCLSLLLHEGVRGRDREATFTQCVQSLFDAVHLPELAERAEKSLRDVFRYVMTHEINRPPKEVVSRRHPSHFLTCYLEAVMYGISRENAAEAKKAQEILSDLIRELVDPANLPEVNPDSIAPILNHIASRFSALCIEDAWIRKMAGCGGIGVLTQIPGLCVKWVTEREFELVRIVMNVLKDMPFDLPRDLAAVMDVLTRIIRVGAEDLGEEGLGGKKAHLVYALLQELASSSAIVRTATQQCIALLAQLAGKTPVDVLLPYRARLLQGLYTKPLRALPYPIQIGIIDAVRYCISLHPPLPELNDELLRLLHETLALADADDQGLIGRNNPRQSTLEITKLRVACIRLLTASMPLTDFFSKQNQTRQRVTTVYFKSLYSTVPEVKEAAHDGLRMVLTHQTRLPKELLQTGLRPILMNLADPKRLSISGLEGLAKLLELLTNYFKVEIGHKLLDHFRVVADPQMLQASSRMPLVESESIRKLVCLANIFHLLPSSANIFLENLVNAIVQTEAQMHFSGQSPFSEPLAKYLDRYPVEAVDFFMRHMPLPRHVRTLRTILQAKLAPNLLRELVSRTSIIAATCLEGRDSNLVIPGLSIFSDLAELAPDWLMENPHVVDVTLALWSIDPTSLEQSGQSFGDITQRYSLLVSILIKALHQTSRIDLLFDIVTVFSRSLPLDLVHISQFLFHHVALSEDLFFRRNMLIRFMVWFRNPAVPKTTKAYFLRYIFTPTILVHSMRSTLKLGLLDNNIIHQVHTQIWQPMNDDSTFAQTDDIFKVELLHLTTVMVHRYPELLQDVKKDIIRCAWHYITSDDSIVKHTAYLLAARFFESFEGPQKFHLRVWTGLLKPPQTEGKTLIRQALDIIAPVLSHSQSSDSGYPQWAKTTRRLLAEEGTGWQQMTIIYNLIVRQPSLFYPVRALFIPHIVNNIPKLGLAPQATLETRLLSVDIAQVIFDWEQAATSSRNATPIPAQNDTTSVNSWVTPLPFRESLISYLVRLTTMALDQASRKEVLPRALSLLKSIVGPSGWTDVAFKLHFFSRALEQNDWTNDASLLSQAQSSAKVLQVISADKEDSWYSTNAVVLTKLVRKGMVSEDSALQDSLHPVLDRLVRLYPVPKEDEDQQTEMSEFHNFIQTSVGDILRNIDDLRMSELAVLRGNLLMLKSVVQATPERIEPFSNHLMKLLGKLTKDHLGSPPSAPTFESNVRLITSILEIAQLSVAYLGEQRKFLLNALSFLVDKSKSATLCRYMLDTARDWAMNKRDPYPTMKEKATLLQKMMTFEHRGERAVFHSYLELVYDIYTDPSLRRTDLTTRLEQPFLLGCRAADSSIRERFTELLDMSIPRSLTSRLTYILGVQNWEALADQNWIFLALHLLLGSVDTESTIVPDRKGSLESSLVNVPFSLGRTSTFIRPIQRLLFLDTQTAHDTWVSVFPSAWACLSRREQVDITHHMITLLSKDYHIKQAEQRPNVIQTLMAGIQACSPPMALPPHLVKYLAKTYGAWHVAAANLESSLYQVREDEVVVRDTVYDALAEVYAEMAEADIFYGVWRRRSQYSDTNVAIAFEQCGMWEQASIAYESAQTKTRAGTLPFSEAEFCLWEDHWILAAEKLQHWDSLHELATGDNNPDLALECLWRTRNWADNCTPMEDLLSQMPEPATPRRLIYEAFISLLKLSSTTEKPTEVTRILDDAMQLTLRKWVGLPSYLSAAHVPILQHFQQFVELQEAVQIFGSLGMTTPQNLEKKSSDLKMVLQAWRERLPNVGDDIDIWSDLVAWRQNVFNSINKTYIPLINTSNQGAGTGGGNSPTFGYRGYHETAWIINRFAHVARKHDLLDVCFTQLNKIYTLPNIEISEAFLKLREQARCHYQKPGDLQAGLEVINNTNLIYFSISQKAEFYTLKGMFHAKFGRNDEANHAFGQAVQLDMGQAKAWAAWGRFNDRMFKEIPNDMSYAANAVSCYMQAAGLYKNRKSRPLLTRVLWLLSVDDGTYTISRAFDTYKGETALWYWISLIPQLCLSISQREVKQARFVLLNLAKLYPQALFFHLRTTKEEMALMKRQAQMAAQRALNAGVSQTSASQAATVDGAKKDPDHPMSDATADHTAEGKPATDDASVQSQALPAAPRPMDGNQPVVRPPGNSASDASSSHPVRQSWDYVDEVVQILKTAFPLLILSMETMVEQIAMRFKATPDDEVYRLVCMLLQDAMTHYLQRLDQDDDGRLPSTIVSTLTQLAQNLSGSTRKEYEDDFIKSQPSLYEYIQRLQQWREKHERLLDARPRIMSLDALSHWLIDFQYGKFDEIEVPGQYTEDKDSNTAFIKILKFGPKYENCRSHGYCWRRLIIYGHDNSKTSFAVQLPSGRHCRREERVMNLFRTFNATLYRKKESRRRNLHFHIPVAVPCGNSLRLLHNDSSYITLGDIYDQHCENTGMGREDPIIYIGEKFKAAMREYQLVNGRMPEKHETVAIMLRKDLHDEVALKMVPEDVLTRFMVRTMDGPCDLWRMRKQFALQLAATSFMTYILCLSSRIPSRFHLSRSTGQIAMSELLPGITTQPPIFHSGDHVPFRLTPNMQHFLGPIFIEGILAAGIMAIGRCLTEPEFDMDYHLCLYVRDETMTWLHRQRKPWSFDISFRQMMAITSDAIVKRAETMACKVEREQVLTSPLPANTVPVFHTVTQMISAATNPINLTKMLELFVPWF